jgi:hypothetical protein
MLTTLEQKLLRLMLDLAARGREITNSAVKLIMSWRKQGLRPEDFNKTPVRERVVIPEASH